MKLAGNDKVMLLRASVTVRSSSGWRSISRTLRANSGSSSRKRTPLCARLTSPGRGIPEPPPIRPASETVWCGARNGPLDEQASARREDARDAVDLGGFESFLECQGREDSGEAFGQHRLARSGRADHQDIVAARRGDLEGAFGCGLAADVAEVGNRRGRTEWPLASPPVPAGNARDPSGRRPLRQDASARQREALR